MIEVSVIIPTYNSEELLMRALKALERTDYATSRFEVLVVDDGSTDNTKAAVKKFSQTSRLNMKYLFQKNRGPGPARNEGIENAQGHIIAFTDADCVVHKDWLQVIGKEVEGGRKLLGGQTYSSDVLIFPWRIAPVGHTRITANLAVHREVLSSVRFDENFLGLLGQDIDFVNRIEDRGYKYENVTKMKVLHPVNTLGYSGVAKRAFAKHNEVQLYKRYGPRVGSTMHFIFKPLILKRFSLAAISYMAYIIALLALLYFHLIVLAVALVLLSFVLFILFFYKYFVTNNLKRIRIPLSQRAKTFVMLAYYLPIYIAARVTGSLEYKFLMI